MERYLSFFLYTEKKPLNDERLLLNELKVID